jgi:hypothetical protein
MVGIKKSSEELFLSVSENFQFLRLRTESGYTPVVPNYREMKKRV